MKRPFLIALVLVLPGVVRAAPIAPPPDFWYVVPEGRPASGAGREVQGIVIPASVTPIVRTGPEGSVISWSRPDGTRRSFVVNGVPSFTLEPGPLEGTTYVPFSGPRKMGVFPNDCCVCASWPNMVESFERKTCISGCPGCGCEACICSQSSPCPGTNLAGWTLVPHDDSETVLRVDRSGDVSLGHRGRSPVRFHGARLGAAMSPTGSIEIRDPESITLEGPVAAKVGSKGDSALFAWSASDATLIVEQPRSFPVPRLTKGTVDLPGVMPPAASATRMAADPVPQICRICGTHPNSDGDLDRFECVPGSSVCYRCISWGCFASRI